MPARRDERKSIFDPIHGIVDLDGAALSLIGQPGFQRLWGIRQTGFAHLVFPGANHTRLEHSLGVFWVAGALADTLGLSDEERQLVTAGALLHDLGHPPFSHTLEPSMVEVLGHGHEAVSRAVIVGSPLAPDLGGGSRESPTPSVLEQYGMTPKDVADLVDPPAGRERAPLLRHLLHGPIDADRIDYLQRDAHYTGVAHGAIDAVRLLATARPHAGRLVFADKGRSAVEGFLVGRALMYASVYYHKTVRAAEVMAQAAVERLPGYPTTAAPLFGLTDGEMLVRLRDAGGHSGQLTRCLTARRLHKRAHGWQVLTPAARNSLKKLRADPPERRAREDALAARIGGHPGDVLFDLAGLEVRDHGGMDWSEVGLLDHERVHYPFRSEGPWRTFTARPPSLWAASVYVAPQLRDAAKRRLAATDATAL
ncbi:MAG: HD domain-containing protein [Thermoplasmata archaeon]|nr:HD domain-containing protein [Thermoplasmata archaeon]